MELVHTLLIEEYAAKLYWMDTGALDSDSFERYYQMLSYMRQKKIDSYQLLQDKKRSLGAGILMDTGLAAYGLCEQETMTAVRKNGKPYLPKYPHIHFNLSYSGNLVLAVFADVETGCDVEQIQEADLVLAEKYFTVGEYIYIAGQPDEKRGEAFYRLWTLKGSFIKTAGMAVPLHSYEMRITPEGTARVWQNISRAAFVFREFRLGGYCAAVCFCRNSRGLLMETAGDL